MSHLVIDTTISEKLSEADQTVALVDTCGRCIGWFHPMAEASLYEGIDAPISAEELEQRSREPDGRTLGEILRG